MLQLLKIKKSILCCLQTAGKVKGVTPEYIRVVRGFQRYYTKGMLVEMWLKSRWAAPIDVLLLKTKFNPFWYKQIG